MYYFPVNGLGNDTELELITLNENIVNFASDVEFYYTFDGIELSRTRKVPVAIYGSNVDITNCSISYGKGKCGIILCDDSNITNCVIAYMDGNGIQIYYGEQAVKGHSEQLRKVTNNYIYDVGRMTGSLGHAIQSEGSAVEISHNTPH